jgi:hypothetical protein
MTQLFDSNIVQTGLITFPNFLRITEKKLIIYFWEWLGGAIPLIKGRLAPPICPQNHPLIINYNNGPDKWLGSPLFFA